MSTVLPRPHPLAHRPTLKSLVQRLHALSLEQEQANKLRGVHFPSTITSKPGDDGFEDQLVALDEDKAGFVYGVLRAMGATRVVEAGTSYGVSLLWLLAAVSDTLASSPPSASSSPSSRPPLVIGTEKEPEKVKKALAHVDEGFEGQTPEYLRVLEGDLLQTLPEAGLEDGSIDALLLDIWAPLTLPVLKTLLPKLRRGAAVFVDNTVSSEVRYKDLLDFIRADGSGFTSVLVPFSCGFDLCIYNGK
ncbi:hypothetical protein JCM8097_005852 [Rhodosporidiobolus ruineniae]